MDSHSVEEFPESWTHSVVEAQAYDYRDTTAHAPSQRNVRHTSADSSSGAYLDPRAAASTPVHPSILRLVTDVLEPYPPPQAYPTKAAYEAALPELRDTKMRRYRSIIKLFLRRNKQPSQVFQDLHVNIYPERTGMSNFKIEVGGLHLGDGRARSRRGLNLPVSFTNSLRSEMKRYLHEEFLELKVIKTRVPSRVQFVFRTEEAAERFIEAFCKDTRIATPMAGYESSK